MNQDSKQQWEKPELIVLVRGTSEEAVLTSCKSVPADATAGPDSTDHGCGSSKSPDNCGACQARSGGAS